MSEVKVPEYQKIIDYITGRIVSGDLRVGDRVPSENELAEKFGVARMTANRAVRELVQRRVLRRVKGAGSYVASLHYEQTPVEISSISEQVRRGGAEYSAVVVALEARPLPADLVDDTSLEVGARMFYSEILHREDARPIQLERRWVNPKRAPDYLSQDFSLETPTEYLIRTTPLSRVAYRISANRPDEDLSALLALDVAEPVLLLRRRTWSASELVTLVDLFHPGTRFSFSGFFDSGLAGERVG